MQKSCKILIAVLIMITILGCKEEKSGNSEKNYAVSKEEIVRISNDLIIELENGFSASDKVAFEETLEFVKNYDYVSSAPLSMKADVPEHVIQIDPSTEDELWKMIGIALFLQGSVKASLRAFLQSVVLSPQTASNLGQAGTALNQLGKIEEALTFLETAKSLDNKDDAILMSLAYSYKAKGDIAKAETALKEAVIAKPDAKTSNEMLMELYLMYNSSAGAMREGMYTIFQSDLISALAINSTQQAASYTNQKSAESNTVTNELMNLILPQGGIQNQEFFDAYLEKHENFTDATEAANTQMNEDIELINSYFGEKEGALYSDIFDSGSCSASPEASCDCATNYVEGAYAIFFNEIYGMIFESMDEYISANIWNLINSEREMDGFIFESHGHISEEEFIWAYNYLYKNFEFNNKNTVIGVATYFNNLFSMQDLVMGNYNYIIEMCDAMEEAKQKLQELEQKARDERLKKIEEQESKALLKRLKKKEDEPFSFEACIDSAVCLGMEGSSFAIKSTGPIFAKFSVDTSKFEIGVRVGVSVGDPTNHIAGADISIGGTVGSSGTTFNVNASQGYGAGVFQKEKCLFNSSFNW